MEGMEASGHGLDGRGNHQLYGSPLTLWWRWWISWRRKKVDSCECDKKWRRC